MHLQALLHSGLAHCQRSDVHGHIYVMQRILQAISACHLSYSRTPGYVPAAFRQNGGANAVVGLLMVPTIPITVSQMVWDKHARMQVVEHCACFGWRVVEAPAYLQRLQQER